MAYGHITFNEALKHGRDLRQLMQQLEFVFDQLGHTVGEMATMVDGDGSSATHFPHMTASYGFETDAYSKAAYEELQAFYGKLNTDASVSNVKAALLQVLSKFG